MSEKGTKSTFVPSFFQITKNCPEHIAKWNEEGTVYLICNLKAFASEYLETTFKTGNVDSFYRQLSYYGFKKCSIEGVLNISHDFFLRDDQSKFHLIQKSSKRGREELQQEILNILERNCRETVRLKSQFDEFTKKFDDLEKKVKEIDNLYALNS